MPIPTVNKGESESTFISRCMSEISSEYDDQKQALAICYSQYKKKEFQEEEIFVLKPRTSENRGSYLKRCSSNNKMRLQYPSLKDRSNFCLTSFNEYYKYWTKKEDFGNIPENSILGECIAKEKAKGVDYKTAYASCSTKVVAPNTPIVLSEDNLIIEPVGFAGPVGIDFDDTLSTEKGQILANDLLDQGIDLHIITRRSSEESADVYKIADELGIPKSKIHFTNGELKWKTLLDLGITKHIDNNLDEIKAIKDNTDIEAIKF